MLSGEVKLLKPIHGIFKLFLETFAIDLLDCLRR